MAARSIQFSILDSIILSSRKGLSSIDNDAKSAALLFLNSGPSGEVVKRGSRIPMLPFPSCPWVGKPVSEIHAYFRETVQGVNQGFSDHNFAVVDEQTLRDGTLLLCSDTADYHSPPLVSDGNGGMEFDASGVEVGPLTTVRADGYRILRGMVPDEMGSRPLRVYEEPQAKAGKRWFVLTEGMVEAQGEECLAGVQAKRARGEPLREAEKNVTGLDDYEEGENAKD